MIDYKELLKAHDADAWKIVNYDRPITRKSSVCISPYNTKTNIWTTGLNMIISMSEILDNRMRIVADRCDDDLQDFLTDLFKGKDNDK